MQHLIGTIDPHDDDAFARWFAPLHRAQQHDSRLPGLWSLEAQRGISLGIAAGTERLHWLASAADGRPLGSLRVNLPHRENTTTASFTLSVDPEHRRRGVGRALLDQAVAAAAAHGRTVLIVQVEDAPDGDGPGVSFLRANGFTPALHEVRRDLALPADEARLRELEERSGERAAGYTLVRWRDAVPEEHLAGRAALAASISTDAPSGDLELEGEVWDGERVRAIEAQGRAMGRRTWATGAIAPDGSLVAVTELAVDATDPEHLWQWDTVVLPAHRGHGLGALVKIDNLRTTTSAWPAARLVTTFNAASNVHMIRVNEAMGFQAVAAESQWQRRLGAG